MRLISRRILLFAVTFVLFFTLFPVMLGNTLPLFPLVQAADVVELVSMFCIIPTYWLLFEAAGKGAMRRGQIGAFILLTTLLALADGLHLAGNSIQHLMGETKGAPSFQLAYFFHKPFSHYALGLALIGLSTILIWREEEDRAETSASSVRLEAFSAILYGFAFFAFSISGKVSLLGLPYSLGVAGWLGTRRKALRARPVLAFFGMAYLLSILLSVGWGIYWNGFPNFDEVHLIGQ